MVSLLRMIDADRPLPYRLLTGPDDAEFCKRVSEALEQGYELHGSPAVTFDGQRVIAAQALVLRSDRNTRDGVD
ncbi:hypothetical protein GCM10029978_117600 [Actinoallomurus acanthiterrae]